MNKSEIIEKTRQFARQTHLGEATGHDWYHIQRVLKMAEYICKKEGGDLFLVRMIALLHDVSDHKLHSNAEQGRKVLVDYLIQSGVDGQLKEEIIRAIDGISFKGLNANQNNLTLEGEIVQDADRIDAIGAIGIARTFAYGGKKNRIIFDPQEKPMEHDSFEEYKASQSCTVNHFYEKLLHLKERLNTTTAKSIAAERHQFMEQYLAQFYKEWHFSAGED